MGTLPYLEIFHCFGRNKNTLTQATDHSNAVTQVISNLSIMGCHWVRSHVQFSMTFFRRLGKSFRHYLRGSISNFMPSMCTNKQ